MEKRNGLYEIPKEVLDKITPISEEDGNKERKMKIWKRITRVLIKTMIGMALTIGVGVIFIGMTAVALAIGGGSVAGTFAVLLFELMLAMAVLHEITEGESE